MTDSPLWVHRTHRNSHSPRDLVKSAMLKFAGTACGQTRLHQKPGEIGGPASREGAAAPGTLAAQPVQRTSFVTFSAGICLYNSVPGLRRVADSICRRETSWTIVSAPLWHQRFAFESRNAACPAKLGPGLVVSVHWTLARRTAFTSVLSMSSRPPTAPLDTVASTSF